MKNNKATIIKSNARYTCQECGSTEFIQAHHTIPGDDDSLICLCADCHSKKHPNVPRALFFVTKIRQPYWHNKSASSIAKEMGVHPRTIIRIARRLEILPGELSKESEQRIKVKAYKQPWAFGEKQPNIRITKLKIARKKRTLGEQERYRRRDRHLGGKIIRISEQTLELLDDMREKEGLTYSDTIEKLLDKDAQSFWSRIIGR